MNRGLKFAPTPKTIPVKKIVAEVESGLRKIPQQEAGKVRIGVTGLLKKAVPPPTNITKEERQAIKSIKEAKELMVPSADKGKCCSGYGSSCKITTMLKDKNPYKELKKDPALSLERKMDSKLLFLNKQGSIPDQLYSRLQSSCGKTPLLYGLPKVHKVGVPLRPIASVVQSLTYQLSKHLSKLLSPLVGKFPSSVKNSKEFATFIGEHSAE